MHDINLRLRSEILECSLQIEKEVNNLILLLLGIYTDNKNTRLFGNRQGIPFKSKIDLLYDLQVLTKEENSDFELLMIFRNKFLHDIDCESFECVLGQLDKGIINRFKVYFEEDQDVKDEKACLLAFKMLFIKNLKVISKKLESKKRLIDGKAELLEILKNQELFQIKLLFNFISEMYLLFDETDLSDKQIQNLVLGISSICKKYVDKCTKDDDIIELRRRQLEYCMDPEMKKEFWNIARLDSLDTKIEDMKKKQKNTCA
jgi:hypothetical protein